MRRSFDEALRPAGVSGSKQKNGNDLVDLNRSEGSNALFNIVPH